jgi:hypothetical protein
MKYTDLYQNSLVLLHPISISYLFQCQFLFLGGGFARGRGYYRGGRGNRDGCGRCGQAQLTMLNGYKNAILYKRCIIYFFVFLFFVVFVFLCLSFTFYVNVFFPLSLPIL